MSIGPGYFGCKNRIHDLLLSPSTKESISRVVLSQTFQTLTKFLETNSKIDGIKLVSLDSS